MSWSYQLQKVNESFNRISVWINEFLARTELCFQFLNERITRLEHRQVTNGLTDEQLERVVRKILAERFSGVNLAISHEVRGLNGDDYFVVKQGIEGPPRVPLMDPAQLIVDPESVPSAAYLETFRMLEARLTQFPVMDLSAPPSDEDETKVDSSPKAPKS